MKLSHRFISLVICLFTPAELSPASLERSVSPSRQFIVFGTDARLRGAISDLAERTKAGALAVLQRRDQWKTPIVIHLQFPQANLPEIPDAALRFSQTGAGLKIQLNLVIGADVNVPVIERELLRGILLEMIYRDQPDISSGTAYVSPPDWLLDGLLAASSEQDHATLVQAIAASQRVMRLQEFLRQKPEQLDSPARMLYRAYSFALVQLLLEGNDGPSRLNRYIENLSRASNNPLSDLKAQFQVFGADVEQVWKSSVARMAATQNYQLLTFAETERRLKELVSIKIPEGGDGTYQLENLVTRKISRVQAKALNSSSANLVLLAASANPLMRPIVSDYQQVAQRLAIGKPAGLTERLARLRASRIKLAARMNAVDDYMNWFEATQSGAKSGIFADYLRAAGAIGKRERHDALSVYLDALESQFQD